MFAGKLSSPASMRLPMFHARAFTFFLLGALALASPLSATELKPGSGNGQCWVDVVGEKLPGTGTDMILRFSLRAHDGAFETDIMAEEWDRAQAALSTPRPIGRQMTLVFDTGMTTTSRSGGYSGFDGYPE